MTVAVDSALNRPHMPNRLGGLIGFRQMLGTGWRARAWVIWFQNVSPEPGITTAGNTAAALFRPIIWTSVGRECSRSRTCVKPPQGGHTGSPILNGTKDQNTKMQQTVIARLQMPGPAAMTRASATPLARQIPALGDRLMVGLQTLTLPV